MEETLYEIIKYGDPILHKPVEAIQHLDQSLIEIINRMRVSMYHSTGVGLAANQVGLPISLALIDTSIGENETDFLVLINPSITEAHGSETDEEGCLSLPGYSIKVPRNTSIFLKAIDPEGKPIEREFNGFLARVIQHELDHLAGKTIIERASPLKRKLLKREIGKLIENNEW